MNTEIKKEVTNMYYYQNIECGNIFPTTRDGYNDMVAEATELYDYGDPTNPTSLQELYRIIEIES